MLKMLICAEERCSYNTLNNKARMEAALINARKLTDTLPTELSVGTPGDLSIGIVDVDLSIGVVDVDLSIGIIDVASDLNRNSAKLLMGSLFLNAPSMVFVI